MNQKFFILLGIFLTGFLSIFIYPTVLFHYHFPDLGILAWVHLVPLLLILPVLKGFKLFAAALFSSFIGYAGTLYWMALAMKNFGGLSWGESSGVLLIVVLILSVYFALAFYLSYGIHRRTRFPLILLIPVFLISFDFLRVVFPAGGFPWPMAGYSQASALSYFQWLDGIGVFGLSFLIFLVNVLIADLIQSLRKGEADIGLRRGIILVVVILVSFYVSIWDERRAEKGMELVGSLHLALVQGNISQDMKWDPQEARENVLKYLELSRQAAKEGAEMLVWPETAYPYTVDLSNLSSLRLFDPGRLSLPTLLGAVSQQPTITLRQPIYYNSALMVGSDGLVKGTYHKMHLVPFGEYVPMKKWLFFARRLTNAVGDFEFGKEAALLSFEPFQLGLLICYEDIFPDISRAFAKKGADLLVNLTNDAWYGDSSAPYQHLVFSQFRALENRRYLVRATNTGITAVIDPHGEVLKALPPFREGILIHALAVEKKQTLYTRFGDWVAWGCIGIAAIALISAARCASCVVRNK